jgi:hypothetical protein
MSAKFTKIVHHQIASIQFLCYWLQLYPFAFWSSPRWALKLYELAIFLAEALVQQLAGEGICDQWVMFCCETSSWLLVAHLCQAKSLFWLGPANSFKASNQIWAKTHMVCSHDTSSVAAGPFPVLHMWMQLNEWWVIVTQAPGGPSLPSEAKSLFWPKLTWFAGMSPHLLLLDHSMSSICDPWVMGCFVVK